MLRQPRLWLAGGLLVALPAAVQAQTWQDAAADRGDAGPVRAAARRVIVQHAVHLTSPMPARIEPPGPGAASERARWKPILIGAAVGGGVGAVGGVVYGQATKDGAELVAVPIFGGIGAGIGAAVGWAVSTF